MSFFSFIFQDWKANKGGFKGRIFTLFFRISNFASKSKILKIIFFPFLLIYKILFDYLIGIEVPISTKIGKGFKVLHLQSIVINKNTIIGENCNIRHSLTIGNSTSGGKSPVIGNNVIIGAHVCIIGDISIGDNAIIGAGSVVVKNVPMNSTVVGNPAKVINTIK